MDQLKSQIGQCFMIGISGTSLTSEEAKFIVQNDIGGVIYFKRNFESPLQLAELSKSIQTLRKKTASGAPIFISADMEGGRVARFRNPFTEWPPMRKVGDLNSTALAFKVGEMLAHELRVVGVNLNFAPCTDVLTNPANTAIGDRSFGTDPEQVAKIASAFARGLLKGGVMACSKHFPGHGNTLLDSHEHLPVESVDLETLKKRELVAFRKVIRARVEFVMTTHIRFEKVDPELPGTLSHKIITELLKDEIGFRGLVITDDLDMKALRNHYAVEEIPLLALKAGCHVLLYCNEPESHMRGLVAVEKAARDGGLSADLIQANAAKILGLKRDFFVSDFVAGSAQEIGAMVGNPEHVALSRAIQTGEVPADLKT